MKSNRDMRWGTILGVLTLLLLLGAVAPSAGKERLRLLNGSKGVPSPVQLRPQGPGATGERAVRLQGRFTFNNRRGLTLSGREVVLSARTAIFPAMGRDGALPDPARLNGLRGTVFGERGTAGVEAVLIVLEGAEAGLTDSSLLNESDSEHHERSPVNPAVGEVLDGAPQ